MIFFGKWPHLLLIFLQGFLYVGDASYASGKDVRSDEGCSGSLAADRSLFNQKIPLELGSGKAFHEGAGKLFQR